MQDTDDDLPLHPRNFTDWSLFPEVIPDPAAKRFEELQTDAAAHSLHPHFQQIANP